MPPPDRLRQLHEAVGEREPFSVAASAFPVLWMVTVAKLVASKLVTPKVKSLSPVIWVVGGKPFTELADPAAS